MIQDEYSIPSLELKCCFHFPTKWLPDQEEDSLPCPLGEMLTRTGGFWEGNMEGRREGDVFKVQ